MPRGAAPPAAERRARGKRSNETENQVRRVYFVLSQTTRVHDTRRKGSRGLPPGSRVFSSGSRGPSRPSAGSMKPDPTRSTETASPRSLVNDQKMVPFLSGGKIRRGVPRALARSLAFALLPPRRPDPPARAERRRAVRSRAPAHRAPGSGPAPFAPSRGRRTRRTRRRRRRRRRFSASPPRARARRAPPAAPPPPRPAPPRRTSRGGAPRSRPASPSRSS